MNVRLLIITGVLLAVAAPAHAETLSRSQVREIVTEAADHYHVKPEWISNAAIDIIFDGVHESSGGCHAGTRKHHACIGIVSFSRSWHFSKYERSLTTHKDPRLSGKASLYRFVRCYRDGGRKAIRKHWRASLGR